ncbi:MAG: cyclase family protein [Planctomycetes bacterium]|nr:cyclase family protein [Planctomycetota bacterium]
MIYDISPPISENLKVWPGDTPPTREMQLDMKRGDNLTLSTLRSTVHLGAHADAPSHYGINAPTIDEQPLEIYIGRCQVMTVTTEPLTRIGPDAIEEAIEAQRVLFHTGSFPDPNQFNEDFAALSPELISELASLDVELVGVDAPSVDLFTSKELPTHKACLEHGMAILEGLVLTEVPDGIYELVALPLKLVGFDASPVRAILRPL